MIDDALQLHLQTKATTVCRAWSVTRRDGLALGFTDHDRDLTFEGLVFSASSGLAASAVEQMTGLAVDNAEAVGLLSDAKIRESDNLSGFYDGAEVKSWLVNWADTTVRRLTFRGKLGEIERRDGGFRAELRSQTDALNQSRGRAYTRSCGAVLGDAMCGVDLDDPAYAGTFEVLSIAGETRLHLASPTKFAEGWFQFGTIEAAGATISGFRGIVKRDAVTGSGRMVELWEPADGVSVGDTVLLRAGCDKRFATCRNKFSNSLNFRGFPDIPGEDWLMSYPVRAAANTGGSRRL